MAETKDDFPAKLKALRKRLGLTQQEAADRVKIARRTWVRWENGDSPCSPAMRMLVDLVLCHDDSII